MAGVIGAAVAIGCAAIAGVAGATVGVKIGKYVAIGVIEALGGVGSYALGG